MTSTRSTCILESARSTARRAALLLGAALAAVSASASGCGPDGGPAGDGSGTRGAAGGGSAAAPGELSGAEYTLRRGRMVERLRGAIRDERLLEALARVPRHEFVAAEWRAQSYDDVALPIEDGQTMYSAYVVAQITALLELQGGEKVLEVGTGSGYQTAVLAELAAEVHSIEILPALKARAEERFLALRARGALGSRTKVRFVLGDGSKGLPDSAPYDAILVSAATAKVPEEIVEQLAPGGRMVIPVGRVGQELLLLRKPRDGGEIERREVGFVRWDELEEGRLPDAGGGN